VKIQKFNLDKLIQGNVHFNLCELTVGSRDTPLEYILSKEDRNDNERTEAPTDIYINPEYVMKHATRYRDRFRNDEKIVFTLLEKELKNIRA